MARRPREKDPESSLTPEERASRTDQAIIQEAKERFKRAQEWESAFRQLYVEDTKFANADSDNGWQWPDEIKQERDTSNRPCLTINKTKMHVLALANEMRQNMPSARVKPVGDKVSFEAAQVWEGLIRHMEYVSNAAAVYIKAKESQLEGGIGYFRVNHGYLDDKSFDQDIFLDPLDTLNTYLDCDIKRPEGSDAMWGFIFEDFDRKEFERQFPRISLPPQRSPGLNDKDDWIRKDGVRVAEYYRIHLVEDELLYMEDTDGTSWTGLLSEIPGPWRDKIEAYRTGDEGADFKSRTVMNRKLQWFKIGGNEILDRRDGTGNQPELKGRYIPIVRMVGRERKIDGQLYRAGITRQLKDPQRMYNYNTSGQVETVATQTKTPWIVATASIESNESAWANANVTNAAYLTYRHIDDEGEPIPPPQRAEGPQPAQGFLEGARMAAAEMEMVSGQYQGLNQAQENTRMERTPQAIDARQRIGELANYDFTFNEMEAIRHTAVIFIDLAPHILDTERVVKIRAQDGTISEITIKPDAEEAYHKEPVTAEEKAVKVLFNPKIGKYAVEADVGPTYQTQRQEAWNAFVQIVTNSPELVQKIGDIGFLAADFPMADKIAERLRRDIEATMPWLLDDSQVGPVVKNLQAELSKSQQQLADLMEKFTEARQKLKSKAEMRDVDVEDMKTRRLTAEGNVVKDLMGLGAEAGLKMLVRQTLGEMLGFDPGTIEAANQATIDQEREPADSEGATQ